MVRQSKAVMRPDLGLRDSFLRRFADYEVLNSLNVDLLDAAAIHAIPQAQHDDWRYRQNVNTLLHLDIALQADVYGLMPISG